jgi:hypothetical protein
MAGVTPIGKSFQRLDKFPITDGMVFSNYEDAELYAADPNSNSYPGQIISVQSQTNFILYVVRTDFTLQEYGVGGVVVLDIIGDGVTTAFDLQHNLGSRDLLYTIYKSSPPYRSTNFEIEFSTPTNVIVYTTVPPLVGEDYKLVLSKGGGINSGGASGEVVSVNNQTPNPVTGNILLKAEHINTSGGVSVEESLSGKVTKTAHDNKVYALYNGAHFELTTPVDTLYVDSTSTKSEETGSRLFPYKSVQSAIDSISTSDTPHKISIRGRVTESVTITDKSNLYFKGTSPHMVPTITGDFIIEGSSSKITVDEVSVSGSLVCDNSAGYVKIKNSSFGSIYITDDSAGDYEIFNTNFYDVLEKDGDTSYLVLRESKVDLPTIGVVCKAGGLVVDDCNGIPIEHIGGSLVIIGDSFISSSDSRIESLVSTCDEGDGDLYIFSGTFYSKIEKTGTCPYILAGAVRGGASDIFVGQRIYTHGMNSADILCNYEPHNYTIDNTKPVVDSHLAGLDVEIENSKLQWGTF